MDEDPGADTEMFRVFVAGGEAPAEPRRGVAPFVLLVGVAVAVVVVVAALVLALG